MIISFRTDSIRDAITCNSAYAKKDSSLDQVSQKMFSVVIEQSNAKKVLYAPSELERDEWVAVIRKYSTQSNIENGYEFTRDNASKLGEGKAAHYPVSVTLPKFDASENGQDRSVLCIKERTKQQAKLGLLKRFQRPVSMGRTL